MLDVIGCNGGWPEGIGVGRVSPLLLNGTSFGDIEYLEVTLSSETASSDADFILCASSSLILASLVSSSWKYKTIL